MLLALWLLASCSTPETREVSPQGDSGGDAAAADEPAATLLAPSLTSQLPLPAVTDLNPDPDILEVELEAKIADVAVTPGVNTPMWTYNGTVPGPLLHAKVGDRLVVHFKNHLPEPTTVHWHGVRVPANMDGTPLHSQPPIPPEGTFEYSFVLPDAGLYWYHPHLNSAAQLGFGLYGAILVDDPHEDPALGDATVVVLSDLFLDNDGGLGDVDAGGGLSALFGREGETLLVNGKTRPTVQVQPGKRQRLRVINAAKSRYYDLDTDPPRPFTVIGSDGGLRKEPRTATSVLVVPGGRTDVLFDPSEGAGARVALRWVAYDRGYGSTFNRPPEPILQFETTADPRAENPKVPTQLRSIDPLSPASATTTQTVQLTQNNLPDGVQLGINGKPFGEGDSLRASAGETQVWSIENKTDWAHPFHLHGFFFQAVDATGSVPDPEWRDTIHVAAKSTQRLIVHFDDRKGMWMFHCHILDHAEMGMMGMLMLQ